MKKIFLSLILLSLIANCHAQIVINEMMTNNQSTAMDEDDEFSDWIEIFNDGPSNVNLQGYYLSDDPDSLTKWQFSNLLLKRDSFLIVWCSGKNHHVGEQHTNFSISSVGETVYLSNPSGIIISSLPSVYLPVDNTYGRLPNGSPSLGYLSEPTFNANNNSSSFLTGLINTAPDFDIPGGFYTSAQNVFITHSDPSVTIHYTLDGSDPTINSPVYTLPINVQSRIGDSNYYSNIRTCYKIHFFLPDWNPPATEVFKCTIIRARAYKTGYSPGPIKTNSYFVDPNILTRYGSLPVISIVSDPKNLFNDTTGIYVPGITYQPNTFFANYYKPWDRPANIEMFLPGGGSAFNDNFKISINGQSSPSSPQKGLNINASPGYGDSKINFPLFGNTTGKAKYINQFEKIKLRAWGSDRDKGLFRDAHSTSFYAKSDLDYEAYQPVVVFIDGEYWGLQEMRERNRNPEYFQSHYFIDKKNPGIDIIDGSGNNAIEGDALHWNAMINFINSNSLSDSANYNYVKTQMDVNSFMLNFMSSIYLARGDWPDQNEAKWRPRTVDGKWKWVQWDMDNTVAYYLNPWYNMFPLVINGSRGLGPSVLLDSLLLSDEFKINFINLFADYMNTEFIPSIALGKLDQMRSQLLPYFNEFVDRWQVNYNWQAQTDSMKWWMNLRPQYVKQHIVSTFSTGNAVNLTLDVSDSLKGNILVNTILLDKNTVRENPETFPWTGQYFSGVPVPITAIAKPGYHFVVWLPSNNTQPTIYVNLSGDSAITALFDVDPNYQPLENPVINEVMSANGSVVADNYGDFDDWLEIYNPNNDTLDIGGYYLTDNLVLPTRFKIAEGSDSTKIPPHGFLLIWIDDDTEQGSLHVNFKFSSSGDFIALINQDGNTIADSISIPGLNPDVSYGRRHDASPLWITFNPSTPNATNWAFSSERVLINELQTINLSTVTDNYGEYNQWIELYNPNVDTIDIAGWKITNDPFNIFVHTFPFGNDSTKIPPYGFKLLWADNDLFQGINHLNFSLQQSGCVSLFNLGNIISDSACYPSLGVNESYGRITDGNLAWMTFSIPTPDSNNYDLTIGLLPVISNSGLTIYPNPLHGKKIYFNKPVTFHLFDALGHELAFVEQSLSFDMSSFAKGVYFIRTVDGELVRLMRQ